MNGQTIIIEIKNCASNCLTLCDRRIAVTEMTKVEGMIGDWLTVWMEMVVGIYRDACFTCIIISTLSVT